jgi:hypothetical protein
LGIQEKVIMPTLANDDNLQSGITYTFTFELQNIFSMPSTSVILADVANVAPSFVSSPSASWASGVGLLTNYLNVTFTYSGDGSDVASDVAASLIQAFQQGSNDDFTFTQATGGTAGVTALSSTTAAVSQVATGVGEVAGTAIGATVQNASSSVFSNLGASGWLVVGLAIIALLAYFSMATGIQAPRSA